MNVNDLWNKTTGLFGNTTPPVQQHHGGKNKTYTYSKMQKKSKKRHSRIPLYFKKTKARARRLSRNRQRNRQRAMRGGNFTQGVIGARSGYSIAGQNISPSMLSMANPAPFTNLSKNI